MFIIYVASRAKQIMNEQPNIKIKEVAFQLGFPTTANFCRYFLRATGIYPQEYKKTLQSHKENPADTE